MDRRGFVTLAGGLLAAPLIISAQTVAKVYQLGAFHVGDHVPPALRTLKAGLAVKGYEEGKNLQLDFRNLPHDEAARHTAKRFVRNRVDLIVAFGNPIVRAARAATSETPIVIIHATAPVAERFVNTLARPGGNLTGFVFFAVSAGKQLELDERDGSAAPTGARPVGCPGSRLTSPIG